MKLFVFLFIATISMTLSAQTFEEWTHTQFEVAKDRLLKNVSPKGTIPGTVVASPSKDSPNYFYHWVRDAALVMHTIDRIRLHEPVLEEQDYLLKHLFDFADVTRIHQQQNSQAGLGEVKFNTNGTAFTGPWGRPQNDGPALRALIFVKLANYLLANNGEAYVREVLYDGRQPTDSIIKKDLEYVSHNWKNHDFDLWEEIMGHHFFTRLAQRRALIEGAKLARRMGDHGAAHWYDSQAKALETALNLHWDEYKGIFNATLNRVGGIDYKQGMDSSVIIAIIEMEVQDDSAFKLSDDRFQSSVKRMNETFSSIYTINHNYRNLGTAIGRYPEDQYDGYNTGKVGNPWFITTAAFASYHYKLARTLFLAGEVKITKRNQAFYNDILGYQEGGYRVYSGMNLQSKEPAFRMLVNKLVSTGDNYMKRIQLHASPDGSLSEQMNRDNGYMQGAPHLTWSYSSYINTYLDRKEALSTLKSMYR